MTDPTVDRSAEVQERIKDIVVRSVFEVKVAEELDRAYAKHGKEPWSRHEFYAILLEEVDELWDDIKADEPLDKLFKELVQVAAMCLRYAETGEMSEVIYDKHGADAHVDIFE